jgi:hypothetical protein
MQLNPGGARVVIIITIQLPSSTLKKPGTAGSQ